MIAASHKNMLRTVLFCMPKARIVPISRTRSSMTMRNVFMMPTAVINSNTTKMPRAMASSTVMADTTGSIISFSVVTENFVPSHGSSTRRTAARPNTCPMSCMLSSSSLLAAGRCRNGRSTGAPAACSAAAHLIRGRVDVCTSAHDDVEQLVLIRRQPDEARSSTAGSCTPPEKPEP